MPERVENIRFPVTTADAESHAALHFEDATLRMTFVDMQGVARRVDFVGVAGFRWSREMEGTRPGVQDDGVYEVIDSDWIRGLREARSVTPSRKFRHIIIGFNEESTFLEVVCESFR
jgi:hypothetical protein